MRRVLLFREIITDFWIWQERLQSSNIVDVYAAQVQVVSNVFQYISDLNVVEGEPVMDPLLVRFYRQYMQQTANLTYPPLKLLLEPDIQDQIYRHFFDGPLKGPPAYQRRVLKQLISLIERAIVNPEEDAVSDPLMDHMGYLSILPRRDSTTEISEQQIITYILPEPLDTPTIPQRILIEETPNLLAAGSNVGLRTWEAGLHLAQYLHVNSDLIRDKAVLELGAGTGLVSILCAGPLGAKLVLATDGRSRVVESMQKNFDRNQGILPDSSERLSARTFDWADLEGLEDVLTFNGDLRGIDVILGADLTYSPDIVPDLAELLRVLIIEKFPKKPVAYISATIRNENTLNVFRKGCVDKGLLLEELTFDCPSIMLQRGFFHEQAFPDIIMKISSP